MTLVPGLNTKQPLTLVAGANVYTAFRAAYRDQMIALAGTSASPWYLTLDRGNTVSGPLAVGATAGAVQAVLMALPRIGGRGGVLVSGSGTALAPYVLTPGGDLARTLNEELGVLLPPGVTATVRRLPKDWTDTTAEWVVAKVDPTDPSGYGTPLITITDSTDPDTLGQVILGFVPPAAWGDAFPTPDPTNGQIALWVVADVVSAAVAALGVRDRADHVLRVSRGGLTVTLLRGPILALQEPLTGGP